MVVFMTWMISRIRPLWLTWKRWNGQWGCQWRAAYYIVWRLDCTSITIWSLHNSLQRFEAASKFFSYDSFEAAQRKEPQFLFGGEDLAIDTGSSVSTNQYSWVTDPDVPWDWGEDTWLVEASPLLSTIKLVEAYMWKSGSYIYHKLAHYFHRLWV